MAYASTHFLEDVGVELAAGTGLPSHVSACWPVPRRSAAALLARCGGLLPRGIGCLRCARRVARSCQRCRTPCHRRGERRSVSCHREVARPR